MTVVKTMYAYAIHQMKQKERKTKCDNDIGTEGV